MTSAKGAKTSTKAKVTTLVIEYTGHNCARGDGCHVQDSGRASVAGNPAGKQTVRLSLQDKNGNSLHSMTMSIKGTTVLFGLPVDTYIRIHDLAGNLLSTVQFHTSCSVPLRLGDEFGSLRVVGFSNSAGATEEKCSYRTALTTLAPAAKACAIGTCTDCKSGEICFSAQNVKSNEHLELQFTGANCVVEDKLCNQQKETQVLGDPSGQQCVHLTIGNICGTETRSFREIKIGQRIRIYDLLEFASINVYSCDGLFLSAVSVCLRDKDPIFLEQHIGSFRIVGFEDDSGRSERITTSVTSRTSTSSISSSTAMIPAAATMTTATTTTTTTPRPLCS